MLESSKSISLTGRSVIDGQPVANFSATIREGDDASGDSMNAVITNRTLYKANKAAVRKDTSDFQTLVYEAQDDVAVDSEE